MYVKYPIHICFSKKAVSLINISSGLSDLSSETSLWSVGFAQSSGTRNRSALFFSFSTMLTLPSSRLAITTVNDASFHYSNSDALFAMFDGGLNNEVPLILKSKLPDILQYEYEQCNQANVYLKHTFLALQKCVLWFSPSLDPSPSSSSLQAAERHGTAFRCCIDCGSHSLLVATEHDQFECLHVEHDDIIIIIVSNDGQCTSFRAERC